MASTYDDELWELVPEPDGPPEPFRFETEVSGRVLDLGCGDGSRSALLDGDLTIADVSPVALARAERRIPGAEAVELQPDAPLPFGDNEFDFVVCAETIEHVRDLQLLLSEARRVLKPGGTLLLTTPAHSRLTGLRIALAGFESVFPPLTPHLRFFSKRSLSGLLADMGFAVVVRRRGDTLVAEATR